MRPTAEPRLAWPSPPPCSPEPSPRTGSSATGRAQLETIKYATSFGAFGRDAFVYVAIEKGYFRDAGFDVQVVPGLGSDNARLLAAGQIDYAGSETDGEHGRARHRRVPGEDRRGHESGHPSSDRDPRRERDHLAEGARGQDARRPAVVDRDQALSVLREARRHRRVEGEDRPRHAPDPPVAARHRPHGCDRPVHRRCADAREGGRWPSGPERSSTRSI